MIHRPSRERQREGRRRAGGRLALGGVLGGRLAEPVGRRAVGVVLELAGSAADLADAGAGFPGGAGDAPVVLAALVLAGLSVPKRLYHRILRPPPPPPRRGPPRVPPPKPPLSREGGRASSTLIVRPSSVLPFSSSIALRPSSLVDISTNPKPRDQPESRPLTMLALSSV